MVDHRSGTASGRSMSERAFNIEKQSFEIIDSEIGAHGYNETEWAIVRRVIHATADFDFAKSCRILFHPRAVSSAFEAIKTECTIVTDVDIVLAAISKKSTRELRLKTVCYISDESLAEDARRLGKTRSEMAMLKTAKTMERGIVVIGNAPTALYEVMRMLKEGEASPAIVIGIPVGFVSASESKEELARANVPFITNVGRKGGSAAASAIVNAIMLLYKSMNSLT